MKSAFSSSLHRHCSNTSFKSPTNFLTAITASHLTTCKLKNRAEREQEIRIALLPRSHRCGGGWRRCSPSRWGRRRRPAAAGRRPGPCTGASTPRTASWSCRRTSSPLGTSSGLVPGWHCALCLCFHNVCVSKRFHQILLVLYKGWVFSDNVAQSFLFFCSCSGAVKKYPKNRMLGQRQVTDGKVKSSLCLFYFDCNLLFF
jgi:hypothetical protein